MDRLSGKIALVTGAARGQGRSHAIRLAEAGAAIIAVDICAPVEGVSYDMATPDDLAQTRELVEATGAEVVTAIADIRDFRLLSAVVDKAVRKLGGLDIVVANAGVVVSGRSEEISQEQWDATIGVNLTGTWNTLRVATPHLLRRGSGSIVTIASVAGLVGLPFLDPYVASKHGIVGLTKAFSLELAEKNIRVNAVCPTGVKDTGMDGVRESTFETASRKLRSTFENAMTVGAVEKSDVSSAVLFLASDEARFVTGTALSIDAGLVTL
jgi:SDR family mycofactocin-dependent oxidoreductase